MNIGESVSRELVQSNAGEVSTRTGELGSSELGSELKSEVKPKEVKPKEVELRVSVDRDREIKKIELEGLDKMVESVNKDIRPINTKLEFSIHEKTNRVLVKIIDNDTDKIIKEIPPEKLVDIKANLLEAAGILIDSKA